MNVNSNAIVVSVVIPLYNEEQYVDSLIKSLIEQTYPREKMEWIFVDGKSKDQTTTIIQKYMEEKIYPMILLVNKMKKTPYALNMGINKSRGKYIVRLDAHSYFYPNYIEKCVYYLEKMDIVNVGGIAETKSKGFIGNSIAKMMSTKFGVGGSDFRIGDGNHYVDTVPFGAFKKEVFQQVGLFNTKLLRSEDNDINSRIRQTGGKIWLASDIKFKYYCRDSIKGILKMGIQNGNALFFTLRENPKAMSFRHFIPFLFLLSLIVLPLVSIALNYILYIFIFEILLYGLMDFVYSFFNSTPQYGFITIWLYPLFHIIYGIGSLLSLFHIPLY